MGIVREPSVRSFIASPSSLKIPAGSGGAKMSGVMVAGQAWTPLRTGPTHCCRRTSPPTGEGAGLAWTYAQTLHLDLPTRCGSPQCLSYFQHSHGYTLLIPVMVIVREPSIWSCITSLHRLRQKDRSAGSGGACTYVRTGQCMPT